ncbi:hypothetical protein ES703_65967 [subsurface metagenome]
MDIKALLRMDCAGISLYDAFFIIFLAVHYIGLRSEVNYNAVFIDFSFPVGLDD